ncbi:MAG: pilus assembly protein N-terminal domain-containing protein [Aminobacterium sp.]|jgi:pilus assembly protein CpaC|uniref:type II and III secretion system protein family protein n=1 Tax=Aminobacterium sp. TaxID=1872491 RepID=UPI001BCB7A28|nr:pilus assembly protein N-terminal domain-containing protein [Aminobacterium sp.]MEA4877433.1 pilus assembly protein N-terminal domain-containing protein [Aminobacterium sp.]
MTRLVRKISTFFVIALVVALWGVIPAVAATYHLDVGDSAVLKYQNVKRMSVGNPDVLDAVPLDNNQILLTGKIEGGAALIVWDVKGMHMEKILVHPSTDAPSWELKELLKAENVDVTVRGGAVVLEGKVKTPRDRIRAVAIAGAFGEKIINLLEVEDAPQIKLRAIVMELKKQDGDKLGLKSLEYNDNHFWGIFDFNPDNAHVIDYTQNNDLPTSINAVINALIENKQAKILSKPYLSTLSGEEAFLNVGGEIPVPVGVDNNEIKVEWKPYGVIMKFTPELDGLGEIWLTFEAEVSEIDWENAVETEGIKIPAIRSRKIANKVRLAHNESLVVGGLLDNKQSKYVKKIPLLGDIPIIGQLFRSKEFTNDETELVITVTPEVVGL